MFPPMRRRRQQLSSEQCEMILKEGTYGVLAVLGQDGYPYTVPLNYYFDQNQNALYFHSALAGHKMDAVRSCEKASFCVVSRSDVMPQKLTTFFESVIAFGRIQILEEKGEKQEAIWKLSRHLDPQCTQESLEKEIDRFANRFAILKLSIEYLSGKQSIELV